MTLPFLRSFVIGFHPDHVRLGTVARTMESICQFGWGKLPDPSKSSDLTPSGFHLLGSLK